MMILVYVFCYLAGASAMYGVMIGHLSVESPKDLKRKSFEMAMIAMAILWPLSMFALFSGWVASNLTRWAKK